MDKRPKKERQKVTKGSKVVCIDDRFPTDILIYYSALPIKDKVYTIRDMGVGLNLKGEHGEIVVYLSELHNPKSAKTPFPERGFAEWRFQELAPPAEESEQVKKLEEIEA